MAARQPATTVLYIGGVGRSGSTLLERILGQVAGFVAVGEVRLLWYRGVTDDWPCGCGRPFSACELWTAVLRTAYGDAVPDPAAMIDAIGVHTRARHLAKALRRLDQPRPADAAIDALDALYSAIAAESGARVIIDSSKLPSYGLLLSRLPSVDVAVVHLVRDARATVFSWRRERPEPNVVDGQLMERLPVWKSSALWAGWNAVGSYIWRNLGARHLLVRYEDFVVDPRRAVDAALSCVGVAGSAADAVFADAPDGRTVRLGLTHSVVGNPIRFATGPVSVHADTEWLERMPRRHRALCTAITWPVLRRYGYPLRARGGPAKRAKRP